MAAKKKSVFLIAAVCFLLGCGVIALFWKTMPALKVGDYSVTQEEFRFYLEQEKAATYAYFATNYAVSEPSADFWNTDYGDGTPLAFAKQRAVRACVQAQLAAQLADQYGLQGAAGFSTLRTQWKQTNKERTDAVSRGSVVYGPVNYTLTNYLNGVFSRLKISTKEAMEKAQPVTELEIEAFYRENVQRSFVLPQAQTVQVFFHKNDACESAHALELDALPTPPGENPFSIWEALYPLCAKNERYVMDATTAKQDERLLAPLLQEAAKLAPGQFSEKIETDEGTYIVYLESRKGGETFPLDEVKNRIRDMLVETRYVQQLAQLQQSVQIKQYNFIYNAIQMV